MFTFVRFGLQPFNIRDAMFVVDNQSTETLSDGIAEGVFA